MEKDLEQQLVRLVVKYREALQNKQYISLEEREHDRSRLNSFYEQLNTIKQKILDSKCYLQLGEIQKQLTNLFLADETTPRQRMMMLAYIVHCVSRPIVFMSGRAHIQNYPRLKHSSVVPVEKEETVDVKSFSKSFRTRKIDPQELQKWKDALQKEVKKNSFVGDLSGKLDWNQAELLSLLAAGGSLTLNTKTAERKENNFAVSVIVKEN